MTKDPVRLRRGRNAGGVLAIASFLTLAVLALTTTMSARDVALQQTLVPTKNAPVESVPPATPSTSEAALSAPLPPVVGPALPVTAPVAPPVAVTTTAPPAPVAHPSTRTAATKAPASTTPTTSPSAPAAGERAAAACPLPLPAPADAGGLANLVAFAPAFGPFEAEAFAFAPAYAPFLTLVGPFLSTFAHETASFGPQYAPLITALQLMATAGSNALAPLYAPFRGQVLSGEATLAAALAPGAETISESAAASCLVDLEGALTANAPSAG